MGTEYGAIMTLTTNQAVVMVMRKPMNRFFPNTRRSTIAIMKGATAVLTRAYGLNS